MSASIHYEDGTLFVKGAVDFTNVMSLYQQSLPFFASEHCASGQIKLAQPAQKRINKINLSALTSNSSAMLALLIEWLKHAKLSKIALKIEALPPQLTQIAAAASMMALVGVE